MTRTHEHDEPAVNRFHVEVRPRTPTLDGHGRAVLHDVRQIGLEHVEGVRTSRVYLLEGSLSEADVRLMASELLTDPVSETFIARQGFSTRDDHEASIEVHPLPGVMNPAAFSAQAAGRRLLSAKKRREARLDQVQTARRYLVVGARSAEELETIADRVLANDCIETWFIQGLGRNDAVPESFPVPPIRPFALRQVPLLSHSDEQLRRLSREGHLFLSLEEMRTIQAHFQRLQRDPTDLELETLAQTWSEHCVHKTLKSAVDYVGDDFGKPGATTARFENLLKDTIAGATRTLKRDWCLSVFVDNAGVIAFDDEFAVAFKVETHNHPSAIEPYGGAATGVGGCIRDIMGCGLGAKPIASTDVFCLAPPDFDPARVPQGVLHPRRVLKGVVGGVRDYGNRMGIPTVNGAIYFDERYLTNPLVYCGCVGLIPRNRIEKAVCPGDAIVVAGGRTGRDGIHGATFSSAELTDTHADVFSHAVQIGNAIQEKTLLDALLIARDHPGGCLFSAVTDCGAGGLSSAVGEMGAETGARVDLEKVPLKYSGLRYDEIWISEAQERMVFSVPPDRLAAFMKVFAAEEVEATVIGEFTNDHALTVRFNGTTVGELPMRFLHEGLPRTSRKATWRKGATGSLSAREPSGATGGSPARASDQRASATSLYHQLPLALSNLNTASKEWVIRQYDHEVQGRSVIKPLVGANVGPSDAAVLRPRYQSYRGIALACGLCPEGPGGDPYWMAIRAVDEALRNVICVGADPDRIAILDNFCWPKCDNEESMGALVRACKGCSDAAIAYGLPFISGKDSLNNEFTMNPAEAKRTGLPERIAIPYTLLISAIGIVPDVRSCVTMDLKTAGNALVLAYAPVDRAGLAEAHLLHKRVASLIAEGRVRAAHDVSDGGLLVAVAEMCIASDLGASVTIDAVTAFEVTATTYVLEMTELDAAASGLPRLGRIEAAPILRVSAAGERIEWSVDDLAAAWRAPLASGGGH